MTIECPKCQHENLDDSTFCAKCGTKIDADIGPTKTIETAKEELKRGSVVAGRYEVIEELGKGGMGKVYKVFDKEVNAKVALKLIKPEIASDKKTIERFRNELKVARDIAHKNVCRMYDLGKEEGAYYITMEYVSGEDLKSFIRRSGLISTGKAISIAKQVCEGLLEAHRLGVVHRDLKPQNIMIDKEGNARIMDFGIARSLREKGITGSGVMIGTPEYMSPEQVEAKEVDQRSDIYSLGIIMYEMLTGRLPFEADTPFAVGVKHKSETPKSPKELNPQIPDDLSGIILKCLEKDKENRYQSAGDVKTELERIEQGLPTTERVEPKTRPLTSREITVQFKLKKIFIPVSIILTALLVGLLLLWRKGPQLEDNKVVVTAFINRTGDSSLDNIGMKVADIVSQGLKTIGAISVGPVAEFDFNGEKIVEEKHYRTISKNTQASFVIAGEFYIQGENLSFHSNIFDAKTTKLLPSPEPIAGLLAAPNDGIEKLRNMIMSQVLSLSEPLMEQWLPFSAYVPPYEALIEFIKGGKLFVDYKWDDSIKSFNRAISIDPNYFLPYWMAAWAHFNQYRYQEAALCLEVINNLQNLSRWERLLRDQVKAGLEGDYEGMFRIMQELEAQVPGTGFSYQLGLDSRNTNRPKLAVEALLRVDPEGVYMRDWGDYWGVLADAYHMIGNHKQELKIAIQYKNQFPESWGALGVEVSALGARGDVDKINDVINESKTRILNESWFPGRIIWMAGRELKSHGYNAEATDMFKQAIDWFLDHPQEVSKYFRMREYLGRAYIINQNLDEAEAVFRDLVDEYPENRNFLGNLGLVLAKKGDSEGARKISDQLQNLNEPYRFGFDSLRLAYILAAQGEKDQAVIHLRKAIREGVSYTSLYCNIWLEPLWDYPAFIELIKPKG
jgi:serine/threonine protein kinase/tetratricopeptide (TPR) repeat protein